MSKTVTMGINKVWPQFSICPVHAAMVKRMVPLLDFGLRGSRDASDRRPCQSWCNGGHWTSSWMAARAGDGNIEEEDEEEQKTQQE